MFVATASGLGDQEGETESELTFQWNGEGSSTRDSVGYEDDFYMPLAKISIKNIITRGV